MTVTRAVTRPVLRYHGGKWRLSTWIIGHFPPHRIYVEPYGGAASVLMHKPRCYAEVYNDLDGDLVNVFKVLRDSKLAHELEYSLRLTPFSRSEFEQAYTPTPNMVEQVRRTIIKSFMGFGACRLTMNNGKVTTGFRGNVTRSGTTPAHDWSRYPEQIMSFCERLQGVVIENRPALEVLRVYDSPETLHYVDPPYLLSTRGAGTDYQYEMSDNDHRELAQVLHELDGAVIVSGYPSELYDLELYSNWKRVARRAWADGARQRTEVLWLSPKAVQTAKQQTLAMG